ncbi:MAG TPA: alpha/beta fold hydrolase [Gemmataceae bacterium]|nr:alpha/beta fold hydrolase [Gemmataceae bacterium]
MRRLFLEIADHPALTISLCMSVAFVLLNLLAYRHAWSMTHFVSANRRTRRTQNLREHAESLSFVERMKLAVKGVALERPTEEMRPDHLELPYEVHTYPGGAGQLDAWYIPHEQSAGLVVLFHGYLSCKAKLLPEIQAFHDLGYRSFAVDFRGSGGSAGDRTSLGYHEADDVVRSVDYVREHWPNEPLILFGHSMGAAAVLRALSRQPLAPEAVVLESPFDRLLSTVEARFATTELPSFPAAQLMVFWGGVQHGYNGFEHNPVEYARRVSCPTLLLQGDRDNRVSCEQIQSIYQNLGGKKQLHIFEEMGHQSFVALRPEEWKERVACFLHRRVLVE